MATNDHSGIIALEGVRRITRPSTVTVSDASTQADMDLYLSPVPQRRVVTVQPEQQQKQQNKQLHQQQMGFSGLALTPKTGKLHPAKKRGYEEWAKVEVAASPSSSSKFISRNESEKNVSIGNY